MKEEDQEILEKTVKEITDKGGVPMPTIADALVKKGVQQGVQQGLEQGVQQGLEQGVQQGLEQGVQQGLEQGMIKGKIEDIENMINEDFPWSIITKITHVTKKQFHQYKKQLGK